MYCCILKFTVQSGEGKKRSCKGLGLEDSYVKNAVVISDHCPAPIRIPAIVPSSDNEARVTAPVEHFQLSHRKKY